MFMLALEYPIRNFAIGALMLLITPGEPLAQQVARHPPTHANILREEYGRSRANNDLLFYHLDIRVDPEKKFLSGKNTIRFKMLKDDTRS